MKKLNNKGFTLIELLAVVVILAVVMGIASTSVLSAMNKSRGGALQDTAMVIANAFNQKYTESLIDGVPSDVYGDKDVLGTGKGYNFQNSGYHYLHKKVATEVFNVSEDDFYLWELTTEPNIEVEPNDNWKKPDPATGEEGGGIKRSFVYFDVSTGKFIVCMFANPKGKYFVDNYKTEDFVQILDKKNSHGVASYSGMGVMYACSNGTKSWK